MKVPTKFFQANADKVWNHYLEYEWGFRKYDVEAGEINQMFDFYDWLENLEDESLASISELPEEFMPDLRAYMNKSLDAYFSANEPFKKLQEATEAAQ